MGGASGVAWSRYDLGLLDRRRGDVQGRPSTCGRACPGSGRSAMPGPSVAWRGRWPRWSYGEGGSRTPRRCWPKRWRGREDRRRPRHCADVWKGRLGWPAERGATGQRAVARRGGGAARAARGPAARRGPRRAPGVIAASAPSARPRGADRAVCGGRGAGLAERRRVPGAIARQRPPGGPAHPPRAAGGPPRRLGRTNRQIGRELGIAEKTTEVHVHHIIGKLGARSRSEVAAWVRALGTGRSAADSMHG